MMRKNVLAAAMSALALAASAGAATAQSAGDWYLGVGVGHVQPKDGNGEFASTDLDFDVGPNTRPTLTLEYFIADNVGIELLAAWPFEHEVEIESLGDIGSVEHLPPTLTLHYYFRNRSVATPFAGAGINYTTFFNEETKGVVDGSKLRLEDSWGLALHAGVDFAINDRSAIRADIRWIDIDAKAELDGEDVGTVEIDPIVLGASYIWKF